VHWISNRMLLRFSSYRDISILPRTICSHIWKVNKKTKSHAST
jgi:hypothetical protein